MAQRSREKVVRLKDIDRVMHVHDHDVGQKVALALRDYHLAFVEPTLMWIRKPWWERFWLRYVKRDTPWTTAPYRVPEDGPEHAGDGEGSEEEDAGR